MYNTAPITNNIGFKFCYTEEPFFLEERNGKLQETGSIIYGSESHSKQLFSKRNHFLVDEIHNQIASPTHTVDLQRIKDLSKIIFRSEYTNIDYHRIMSQENFDEVIRHLKKILSPPDLFDIFPIITEAVIFYHNFQFSQSILMIWQILEFFINKKWGFR